MFCLSLPCICLPDISIYCKHLNTRWKKCNTCLVKITHWNYNGFFLKLASKCYAAFVGWATTVVQSDCVFVFPEYHSAPVIVLDVASKHTSITYL